MKEPYTQSAQLCLTTIAQAIQLAGATAHHASQEHQYQLQSTWLRLARDLTDLQHDYTAQLPTDCRPPTTTP
jgi:hypothetical protein